MILCKTVGHYTHEGVWTDIAQRQCFDPSLDGKLWGPMATGTKESGGVMIEAG
jgi:hypothetical protein